MTPRRFTLLLLGITSLVLFLQFTADTDSGSIYSYNPHGTRAFFKLLSKMEHKSSPLLHPISNLPINSAKKTLVIASPSSLHDLDHLKQWAEAGNNVVIFGQPAVNLMEIALEDDNKDSKSDNSKDKDHKENGFVSDISQILDSSLSENTRLKITCPNSLNKLCHNVKHISFLNSPLIAYSKIHLTPKTEVLASYKDKPLVLKKPLGTGQLWYFVQDIPIQNEYIDKDDNLALVYQIISQNNEVLFDEFHHGHTTALSPTVKRKLASTNSILGYLAFTIVIIALTSAIRFGPPLPELHANKSSSSDFVSALGLLYCEHNAFKMLRHYVSAWKARASELYKLNPRLATLEFIKALSGKAQLSTQQELELIKALSSGAFSSHNPQMNQQHAIEILEHSLEINNS